jgi:hypothetical protein
LGKLSTSVVSEEFFCCLKIPSDFLFNKHNDIGEYVRHLLEKYRQVSWSSSRIIEREVEEYTAVKYGRILDIRFLRDEFPELRSLLVQELKEQGLITECYLTLSLDNPDKTPEAVANILLKDYNRTGQRVDMKTLMMVLG